MKFFKSVRAWLATALCACMCITGRLAVNSLTKKEAQATTGATVEVSSDIQAILDGWNSVTNYKGSATGSNYSAAYGEWTLLDGSTKVKGIKLTLDQTGKSSADDLVIPSNLLVDLTALKAGPNEVPAFAFIVQPTTVGAKPISQIVPHFLSEDDKEGFGYVISGTTANTVTNAGPRIYGGGYSYKGYATYYHNYPKYAYGSSNSTRTGYDLIGNSTEPFKIWYDGAHNVTYATCTKTHSQKDGTYITGVLGQDPKTYSDLNGTFVNPFADLDGVTQLVSANSEWTGTFYEFDGFSGKGRIGLRLSMGSATKVDVILTAYAGVDLTNPQATSPAVLTANDKVAILGEEISIPAPKYETALGNNVDKTFNGIVNVYAGKRDYLKPYTAYGAGVTSLIADLGVSEALYTNKSVNDVIDITEVGNYTLEYVDTDGTVTYRNVLVSEGCELSLEALNCTITKNGNVLETGSKLGAGDVIKVVPNDGFNYIYPFAQTADHETKCIMLNGERIWLTTDNEYTITEEDIVTGTVSVVAAAYTEVYGVKIIRYSNRKGNNQFAYFYGGIPSDFYEHYDPDNIWRLNGVTKTIGFYGHIDYDGEEIRYASALFGATYTDADGNTLSGGEEVGVLVSETATGNPIGITKRSTDVAGKFPLTTDITLNPWYIRNKVTSNFIKTAGTVGLSVKFSVHKADYDTYLAGFVEKTNVAGFETTGDIYFNATAVPAKYYDEIVAGESFNETDKVDPYRFEKVKSKYAGKIQTITVDNWAEDETDENGDVWKNFYVTIKNINVNNYAEGYYIGAVMNWGSFGGGGFMRFGRANGNGFACYSVVDVAKTSFSANVTTENDGTATASVSLNGVDYYSSTVTEREIEILVKFYNYGLYLKGVSLESIDGYEVVSVDDVTYYVDGEYVTVDTAEQIITFAKNVMGVA